MEKVLKFTKLNMLKKGMLAVILSLSMAMALPMVSHATTVTTSVYSITSGTYYYYVRKSGSSTELGVMKLSSSSTAVKNTFTASVKCENVTVYVRDNTSVDYASKSDSLAANKSITASKTITNYVKTYGYCSVTY